VSDTYIGTKATRQASIGTKLYFTSVATAVELVPFSEMQKVVGHAVIGCGQTMRSGAAILVKHQATFSRRSAMNHLNQMLERNKAFATQQSAAGALMPSLPRALPNVRAIIIGCADMRVDPAHLLGIKPGEAVVIRNIGGRITPGVLEQLGLLGRIGEVARAIPGGGGEFHIIILHHTDCGITRLAGDPAMLTHYFQIPEGELKTKAVTDPRAAVAVDVASLRSIPALPGGWLISGLVYDVATGLVEVVVPPAAIRATPIQAA
jgi:carbonic anhydrase